jgi:hypothetical protein
MERLKLVVSGRVGAGKTTFIRSLSEVPVVDTDEFSSEEIGKEKTTVAMDFGMLRVAGAGILIFGTPGQERFSFAWDILMEGAFGLVFLVRGDAPQEFAPGRRMLDYLTSNFPVPFVLGVTRQDLPQVWSPDEVAALFRVPPTQVLGLNATSREDSRKVLRKILELWGVGQES